MHQPVLATPQIPTDVASLRSSIAGDVYVPGDAGYDEARQAWNLYADQRPSVIVMPESAIDVVKAVRFARAEGLRVAPQGTGHGASSLESLEGTMLLKTTRMRRVDIYPSSRTARAEAGAEWHEVTIPAAEHGLAALAGSAADVGVVGYTLGGGMGWLARRHGLAADSVTAVEIVTPDGRLVRADADNEPELLWAVRGGGGQVGIVTAIEFTLYPVRELYAGTLFFPIERSAEVLHAWREWTATVPEEVTSVGRILQFPPIPDLPDFLSGKRFVVVEAAYLGDEFEGAELIRPLRELGPEMDTFAMIPAPALQELHMDPPQPVPYTGEGQMLGRLDGEAIDRFVAAAGPQSSSPLVSAEIRHVGGALSRPQAHHGALSTFDAEFLTFGVGMVMDDAMEQANRAQLTKLAEAFAPYENGRQYLNFTESHTDPARFYTPTVYRRLREVKAAYDPTEVFRSNHPIPPA